MNNHHETLAAHVDTQWTPQPISVSEALATKILSEDFQNKLRSVQEDYEKVKPNYIAEYDREYVMMEDRLQILEKHFDFGELWFSYDFIDRESDLPVCVGTLLVMTENGYEPWITRLGRGKADKPSADGFTATAETSAKRRLLCALGMGSESEKELDDLSDNNAKTALSTKLMKVGQSLKALIDEYRTHHTRYDLPELGYGKGYPPGDVKKSEDPTVDKLKVADVENLLTYMNKRKGS